MDSKQNNLIANGSSYSYREEYMPYEQQNPDLHKHKKFDYYWNNYGFRSIDEEDYSLDDLNDIWCFGCSLTLGVGVSRQDIWPSLIQQKTKRKVKNFAVGGAGPKTTLRILTHWYDMSKHKPNQIFILGFFLGRNEVWNDITGCYEFSQHNPDVMGLYDGYIKDIMSVTDNIKLIDVQQSLEYAKKRNVKDWGRDGCEEWVSDKGSSHTGHPGVKYHTYISDRFINEK